MGNIKFFEISTSISNTLTYSACIFSVKSHNSGYVCLELEIQPLEENYVQG